MAYYFHQSWLQNWYFLRYLSTESGTVPCKKTCDFAHFPCKLAIFEWGFWAIIALLFLWISASKQCEIGGFQKGITCPCASRGFKVAGCQTFLIFQKSHFPFCVSYFHRKTAPPMNTVGFFTFCELHQLWQAVILKPIKLEECILHFWKSPIFINVVPTNQGHSCILNT